VRFFMGAGLALAAFVAGWAVGWAWLMVGGKNAVYQGQHLAALGGAQCCNVLGDLLANTAAGGLVWAIGAGGGGFAGVGGADDGWNAWFHDLVLDVMAARRLCYRRGAVC
jgi:hypothetical protein